jgi:hypothetical protein
VAALMIMIMTTKLCEPCRDGAIMTTVCSCSHNNDHNYETYRQLTLLCQSNHDYVPVLMVMSMTTKLCETYREEAIMIM